jgi:hypothetical protein
VRWICIAAALLLGCGEDATNDEPDPPPPPTCDGVALPDGSCLIAGVTRCVDGFSGDTTAGCAPILPAAPCAPGTMALPGETECREVAPCGDGDFGDIIADANTQHVDVAFSGASDGSAAAPWASVQAALNAAQPGAVVALAAGVYMEDVLVDKAVTLWGRCPLLVEVVGVAEPAAVLVVGAGARVRGIAIRGPNVGLGVAAAEVEGRQLWIHDTGGQGIALSDAVTVPELSLEASLIESATTHGVVDFGGALIIDASVIRDTRSQAGAFGRGIELLPGASLWMTGSIVERNREVGVFANAASVSIAGSVVRDQLPNDGASLGGKGVVAQSDVVRATLELNDSVFERNHDVAINTVGADAVIADTTVRDVFALALGGRGMSLETHPMSAERSSVSVSSCVIERTSHAGIVALGSDLTVDTSVVRDVVVDASDPNARGISAQVSAETAQASQAIVRSSVVQGVWGAGVGAIGSSIDISSVAVLDTLLTGEGISRGINIQLNAADQPVHLYNVLVRGSAEFGVAIIDAAATLDLVHVEDSVAPSGGIFGDGIVAESGEVIVIASRVARSGRAGMSCFGTKLSVGDTRLECNSIQLNGQEAADGSPFAFDDLGNNTCGCGDTSELCKVLSSALAPPSAL